MHVDLGVSFFEEPVDQLFLKKHTFAVIPSGYQTLDMLGIVGIKRVDDNYYVAKCPRTYSGFTESSDSLLGSCLGVPYFHKALMILRALRKFREIITLPRLPH
jgi:hypothetical protein